MNGFLGQDLFAYQGVYQRHLLRHRENNEIGEEELGPILADSLRVAAELSMNGQTLVSVNPCWKHVKYPGKAISFKTLANPPVCGRAVQQLNFTRKVTSVVHSKSR